MPPFNFKIVYACGHEFDCWREAGVSDHMYCSCVSCHPEPVHRSPFKCKQCHPATRGKFYILHAIGGPSCCVTPGMIDYHCQQELRQEGHLPWHTATASSWTWSWGDKAGQADTGYRVECFKNRGSFSVSQDDLDDPCEMCHNEIEPGVFPAEAICETQKPVETVVEIDPRPLAEMGIPVVGLPCQAAPRP